MQANILILFIINLLLPAYFIYALWTGQERSRFHWLVRVATIAAYILLILLVGRWDWVSYYFRYILVALFVVADIISYQRVRHAPLFVRDGRWWWLGTGGALLGLLLLLGMLIFTVRGYFYAGEPARLTFPLRDGWYYVGQGGNSSLINYHNTNQSQRYAIDLLQLNAAGTRAWGIYPAALDQYVIFGATIYSPCDGIITEAVDDLPDHIPPATDREHPAGNHVVITCQGLNVLLAHMQQDSLIVHRGDSVVTGQPLGIVGNSGNTSEPHLHIHAVHTGSGTVAQGEGVPILFEGKFPVRNTTFVK